jgi:hypothetical protein
MTMLNCSKCGAEIGAGANACKKCGAPIPASRSGFATFLVILLGIITAAVILNRGSHKPEKPEQNLRAIVQNLDVFIKVKNLDTFDWENCDLDLNSKFSKQGVRIVAGKELIIPSRDFVTNKGERFNPDSMKPMSFHIYCRRTPHGTLSYFSSWK